MQTKMDVRGMTHVALGAVLIAVCSWITVPSAVPFTLQTFAVFAVCALLGGKRGTIAMLLYIFMGTVGLPVFSGFNAGFGALLGPTGGFILGFLLCTLLYWLLEKHMNHILLLVLGTLLCYAFGTLWFVVVYSSGGSPVSVGAALVACVLPFIVPDGAKLALAAIISRRIGRHI